MDLAQHKGRAVSDIHNRRSGAAALAVLRWNRGPANATPAGPRPSPPLARRGAMEVGIARFRPSLHKCGHASGTRTMIRNVTGCHRWRERWTSDARVGAPRARAGGTLRGACREEACARPAVAGTLHGAHEKAEGCGIRIKEYRSFTLVKGGGRNSRGSKDIGAAWAMRRRGEDLTSSAVK